jgi:hypothetical protein
MGRQSDRAICRSRPSRLPESGKLPKQSRLIRQEASFPKTDRFGKGQEKEGAAVPRLEVPGLVHGERRAGERQSPPNTNLCESKKEGKFAKIKSELANASIFGVADPV